MHCYNTTMQEKNNININGDSECLRCGCQYEKRVTFPPGYKFNPTDEELVEIYLKKKLMKTRLPFHDFMLTKILETDIYKETTHPETLAGRYKLAQGEKDWYFFTPRDRKYPKGDRPNRAAGVGYWKATGADKAVMSKGVIVGYRKSLVFYVGKKPPKGKKTNWIMHEYRYNGSARKRTSPSDMKLDDWVLCRIYKKAESAKSKSNTAEMIADLDTEEGESPAESALDKNQINQDESRNDEDDNQLFLKSGENVGMFMNLHNVEQQQQQQQQMLPFNPYYGVVTKPHFQSGSLAGHSPHVNNLPFSELYDQNVPKNEKKCEFQQPPPLQIVQPFGFNPPMKSDLIPWEDYYLAQDEPPMKSDLITWDDDYLAQDEPPMNSDLIPWDDDYLQQPQHQQDDELYSLVGRLAESDENIDPDLAMPGESHFGQNNFRSNPHDPQTI